MRVGLVCPYSLTVPGGVQYQVLALARSLRTGFLLRAGDDPPTQLLHLDDLAAAVDVARRERLDGVVNVAPDGWIEGEDVRALAGTPPRLPVPAGLAQEAHQTSPEWDGEYEGEPTGAQDGDPASGNGVPAESAAPADS